MAKKSTKPTVTPQPAAPSEPPAPPLETTGSQSIGKAVDDALSEIAKVQAKRAELTGLLAVVEKQKAKLREVEASYQAAEGSVDQLQAELIAKYPAAAGVFGDTKAPKRGGSRKASNAGRAKKSGPVLDKTQADQVLAALPSSFQLADFKTKSGELFPGVSAEGAMKLLADKVKDAGGKGMGRNYKKA